MFLSARFFYFGRFSLFRKAGSPAPSLKRVPVLRCKTQSIGFLRFLSPGILSCCEDENGMGESKTF